MLVQNWFNVSSPEKIAWLFKYTFYIEKRYLFSVGKHIHSRWWNEILGEAIWWIKYTAEIIVFTAS